MSNIADKTEVQQLFNDWGAMYEKSAGGCTLAVGRRVLDSMPPLDESSVVLDNACGTGLVAAEVHLRAQEAVVHAVDVSQSMIDVARAKFVAQPKVHCALMAGEELSFPNDTFTHSVTNLGILFFSDPAKGASHIYRTLKPGGVAGVTSWSKLGYLEPVQQAQRELHPDTPLFQVPIPDSWFRPAHMEKIMKDAGFDKVTVTETNVYFLVDSLPFFFNSVVGKSISLGDEEFSRLRELFMEKVKLKATPYTKEDGTEGLGVPMTAIVAICEK
ncbi:S-adenosyl-L-methionine-dependent methyltransferase [Thozetella sp. PMI_491]|nr:S-adenosyl-L-methionine-dependent methyltransferase [Thozetella sp. PMI_491]